jgi:hypothetical protein
MFLNDIMFEAHGYFKYSLRPIIFFVNIDISKHILVIDTSILTKSNMDRREYMILEQLKSHISHMLCPVPTRHGGLSKRQKTSIAKQPNQDVNNPWSCNM